MSLVSLVLKAGTETTCRNPFDVTGARSAGLQAIWVDRPGKGWVDRASRFEPSKVVRSLGEIAEFVKGL